MTCLLFAFGLEDAIAFALISWLVPTQILRKKAFDGRDEMKKKKFRLIIGNIQFV